MIEKGGRRDDRNEEPVPSRNVGSAGQGGLVLTQVLGPDGKERTRIRHDVLIEAARAAGRVTPKKAG